MKQLWGQWVIVIKKSSHTALETFESIWYLRDVVLTKVWERIQKIAILKHFYTHFKGKDVETPFPRFPAPLRPWGIYKRLPDVIVKETSDLVAKWLTTNLRKKNAPIFSDPRWNCNICSEIAQKNVKPLSKKNVERQTSPLELWILVKRSGRSQHNISQRKRSSPIKMSVFCDFSGAFPY